MSPTFRRAALPSPVAESPERLFDDLPRTRTGGPASLWAHQADILREYHRAHQRTADIALELPTGAGKTLPGLLIAEWRRRAMNHRVLYATPTKQLAHQTAAAASAIGLEVVTLTGSHRSWSVTDKVAYERGSAVAITTYSTIFNGAPQLEPAQTLLFDDAHAGEQYVASSWSIDVSRFADAELYTSVLAAVRGTMSGVSYQRLLEGEDPFRRTVQLIGVAEMRRLAPGLAEIFRALDKGTGQFWANETIGDRLDRCVAYVAWDGILIRPVLPPTGTHRHFTAADQRIYLSATLGDGGELERAFGRAPIVRLPVPDGWDTRGAGRRFFVFPELQTAEPARVLASRVVAEAGKALVLAPSRMTAIAASDLAAPGTPVIGPDGTAETLLDTFRASNPALLTLANRYDGLDLPDAQSRVTVLDGMPRGAHLQERFISEPLAAGRVLRERVRTRVVQGAGRCTRGLNDFSVVVVLGDAATRFFGLPDVLSALRPDLQAEVNFGFENSKSTPAELVAFVKSFLAQDRDWREQAEPALLEARKLSTRSVPQEAAELAVTAKHEVAAISALWAGDWVRASAEAVDAATSIRSKGLAGYRGFWLYLASAWLDEAADAQHDDGLRATAADHLRGAYRASRNTPWLREVKTLPTDDVTLDEVDEAAVRYALEHGPRGLDPAKWATAHTTLIAGLSNIDAGPYEDALSDLGALLGAEAYKPAAPGRTDSAWIWEQRWLAIEAKTEEKPGAPVSLTTIRQVNDQLKTLAHDRGIAAPEDSAVLLVGPRVLIDQTAVVVAEPFVYVVLPDLVLALAGDAVEAWRSIRAQAKGMDDSQTLALMRRVMSEHHVLPSDVQARLLQTPVRG
ncbi:MAG: DEAD/DEAH box helicase [Cellulomonas sp.]